MKGSNGALRRISLPGEGFSERVLPCKDDDAGQPFQILVRVRYPVFILTASPRLQRDTKHDYYTTYCLVISFRY